MSNGDASATAEEKLLLCQLYESSTLLAQLGALVSEGLDRLMLNQGNIIVLVAWLPISYHSTCSVQLARRPGEEEA